MKQTPLHDRHVALGAVMSPFAGYDMPIRYGGIISEHNAVRNSAGIFDVSHMGEIFVSGPDAEKFVNHIFTADITAVEPGSIHYGMMCYPDGGVVDDLLVYKEFEEAGFLLVVNASNIDKDDEWMRANAQGFDVVIDNRSEEFAQVAIQGPESEGEMIDLGFDCARDLTFYTFCDCLDPEGNRVIVSRTGYTGEDGFEIYGTPDTICKIWDQALSDGIAPCGLGCRDTLRFEAGMPLYGDELSAEISPVMAGLSVFCKFDKPEFIGKDALAVQKEKGVGRKLVGLEMQDRAIPRAGYPVELEDGTVVGVVTTGYHSITLDRSIAFALVDSEYSALGTEGLNIRIRNKVFPAVVVKKKFYNTNYKK